MSSNESEASGGSYRVWWCHNRMSIGVYTWISEESFELRIGPLKNVSTVNSKYMF